MDKIDQRFDKIEQRIETSERETAKRIQELGGWVSENFQGVARRVESQEKDMDQVNGGNNNEENVANFNDQRRNGKDGDRRGGTAGGQGRSNAERSGSNYSVSPSVYTKQSGNHGMGAGHGSPGQVEQDRWSQGVPGTPVTGEMMTQGMYGGTMVPDPGRAIIQHRKAIEDIVTQWMVVPNEVIKEGIQVDMESARAKSALIAEVMLFKEVRSAIENSRVSETLMVEVVRLALEKPKQPLMQMVMDSEDAKSMRKVWKAYEEHFFTAGRTTSHIKLAIQAWCEEQDSLGGLKNVYNRLNGVELPYYPSKDRISELMVEWLRVRIGAVPQLRAAYKEAQRRDPSLEHDPSFKELIVALQEYEDVVFVGRKIEKKVSWARSPGKAAGPLGGIGPTNGPAIAAMGDQEWGEYAEEDQQAYWPEEEAADEGYYGMSE